MRCILLIMALLFLMIVKMLATTTVLKFKLKWSDECVGLQAVCARCVVKHGGQIPVSREIIKLVVQP